MGEGERERDEERARKEIEGERGVTFELLHLRVHVMKFFGVDGVFQVAPRALKLLVLAQLPLLPFQLFQALCQQSEEVLNLSLAALCILGNVESKHERVEGEGRGRGGSRTRTEIG